MNRLSTKFLLILSLAELTRQQNLILASATTTTPPIVTRSSKAILPANLMEEAKKTKMSILKPKAADLPILYKSYPDGSMLFPANPDVASKFNTMITAIKANPDLIEFFRKIHIKSLNMLYEHLMKIYLNFNLTSPGCSQDKAEPTANVADYLADEATYATNKKKLLMNHFVNLIHEQFSASIISYVPTTPPDSAVSFGKIFIENDYSIDLRAFALPQTDPKIIESQATYIQFLKKYIDFFQTYTSYLAQNDANGVNQYYTMALNCAKASTNKTTNASNLNPSMFFYDVESMRSIQFIPFVASTIPEKSQLIPWAPVVANAAAKNLTQNGHPIAYFKDAAGKKTASQQQARSLYLLVQTGPSLFEEELLAQPAWLNTKDGSIRILRGCLGDFSALVGTGILDETLEKIIQKATNPTQAQALTPVKK